MTACEAAKTCGGMLTGCNLLAAGRPVRRTYVSSATRKAALASERLESALQARLRLGNVRRRVRAYAGPVLSLRHKTLVVRHVFFGQFKYFSAAQKIYMSNDGIQRQRCGRIKNAVFL